MTAAAIKLKLKRILKLNIHQSTMRRVSHKFLGCFSSYLFFKCQKIIMKKNGRKQFKTIEKDRKRWKTVRNDQKWWVTLTVSTTVSMNSCLQKKSMHKHEWHQTRPRVLAFTRQSVNAFKCQCLNAPKLCVYLTYVWINVSVYLLTSMRHYVSALIGPWWWTIKDRLFLTKMFKFLQRVFCSFLQAITISAIFLTEISRKFFIKITWNFVTTFLQKIS